MSNQNDPLLGEEVDLSAVDADQPINNRLGMSNVRQALGRWWLMLIFAILGYIGALYYMSIIPPSSEAVATLELDVKQRKLIGEDLNKEANKPEIMLGTIINKMTSKSVLLEVANHPDVQALQTIAPPEFSFVPRYWRSEEELDFAPASELDPHDIVGLITKGLLISPRRDTLLIDIRCSHPDPNTARVLVDTLISVYLDKVEAQLSGGSTQAYQILKLASEEAKEKMIRAENSLQVYVSARELSRKLQKKHEELTEIRQVYKSKHPTRIREEAVYSDLLTRFRREIKRASQNSIEKSYWLEHKDEMERLEAILDSGASDAVATATDEWVALTQSALSSRANLLNKTVLRETSEYNVLTRRMTEIDVRDDESMNNLRLVESAFIGVTKDSLRLGYLGAGSLLGAFAGFAVAYILSVVDYKIYDVRSAEDATGLTSMAAIPASSRFERLDEWNSILTLDPNSANSESIRNLRASVVLLGKKERNKVLLITSSIPGEGKTTISCETAGAFAMNKEKTLLIDMDLRRPKLTDNFPKVKGKPGIVDVFAGQAEIEDVIHSTHIPQLDFIGSGSKATNPSELLHEGDFVELLETLKPKYDRIVIDSAPVLPVSDSRLLAKHVQKVMIVVRCRKTPVGAIVRAKNLLEMSGGKIAGVIVNGMKRSSGGAYFNGYKGYGEYGGDDYGYYGDKD